MYSDRIFKWFYKLVFSGVDILNQCGKPFKIVFCGVQRRTGKILQGVRLFIVELLSESVS